jgi:hypothetical protein
MTTGRTNSGSTCDSRGSTPQRAHEDWVVCLCIVVPFAAIDVLLFIFAPEILSLFVTRTP